MKVSHPWEAKIAVAILMLALAFLGMITTDIHSTGGWDYWRWVVPVYALLALWLSWYVKRKTQVLSPITLWHELFHWAGVILAVFLVTCFVNLGSLSRFNAGLFDLTLLALGIFLAGVYIESTFILIGLILGLFAYMAAFVAQYLYAFLIPIFVAGVAIIALTIWLSHRKFKSR